MIQTNNTPRLIFLFAALVSLVLCIESIRSNNLFWGPLHNSAHSFFHALLVVFLFNLVKLNSSTGLKLASIMGGCFFLGIGIEIMQPFFGRDASTGDIYYNFVGICAGALSILGAHQPKTLTKLSFYFWASLLLLSALFVPLSGAYTMNQRDKALPTLLDFEQNWQHQLYRAGGGSNISLVSTPKGWSNSSTTLKVDFVKSQYPGFTIKYITQDWSGYEQLTFDVYSKLDKIHTITIRIHDDQHNHDYDDRFNMSLKIRPGLNRISIQFDEIERTNSGRQLDIARIAELGIFSVKPKTQFSLYFDNFELR